MLTNLLFIEFPLLYGLWPEVVAFSKSWEGLCRIYCFQDLQPESKIGGLRMQCYGFLCLC